MFSRFPVAGPRPSGGLHRTPFDTPSRLRVLVPLFAVLLLAASSAGHSMLEHERNATGYSPPAASHAGPMSAVPSSFPNVANYLEKPDPSLALYREPLTRDEVIDFFVDVAGDESLVVSVLEHAERYDITPTQAFTVAFIESSFRTDVVNYNPASSTTDRGLFQLNDRTFPFLSDDDFFHPDTNSAYAMGHLRYALNRAGEDYATAIAIYNAGERRVLAGQTPESTQAYVRRATEYRAGLLQRFRVYMRARFPYDGRDDTPG